MFRTFSNDEFGYLKTPEIKAYFTMAVIVIFDCRCIHRVLYDSQTIAIMVEASGFQIFLDN